MINDIDEALRRVALVPVDFRRLAEVMRLPEGCVIDAITADPHYPHRVYLRVRNPKFPALREGEALREVNLVIYDSWKHIRASEFQL